MSRFSFGLSAALFLLSGSASAHHSFASYFLPTDPRGFLSLQEMVIEFHFRNPHGLLLLQVVDSRGGTERWTIETLAPAMLARSGWSGESLTPGERITVEGWRARDGSKLMRLQSVTLENGVVLGQRAPSAGARQ